MSSVEEKLLNQAKPDELEVIKAFETVFRVVSALRDPQHGCPWDLKQTHQSLKPYLLEESYEVLEAIDRWGQIVQNKSNDGYVEHRPNSDQSLAEELGDVLLQVLLHAQIASDDQRFTLKDVMNALSDKLIRRHPHVFGDVQATDADTVVANWQAIKAQEKSMVNNGTVDPANKDSILSDIFLGQPALPRATQLSKRAVKHGFKWPSDDSLWQCVMSEFDEFKAECDATERDKARLEDEMGDIFFATVSLANHYGVDPETALARANAKFTRRFQTMEQLTDTPLKELSFEAWDTLWKQAKNLLKTEID